MIKKYAEELLLICGCALILFGLSMWNLTITLVTGGCMLIGAAFLIGKVRTK